ncbi:hypothetical protein Q4491_20610 [Photobacterium sp. 2_MG-2023]|nr:hypothetical protein [Photobacterium sp. 2_MG-2023]MDO6583743.1 hypothetical protein [Photobacterium sp. 2_MG-2023]
MADLAACATKRVTTGAGLWPAAWQLPVNTEPLKATRDCPSCQQAMHCVDPTGIAGRQKNKENGVASSTRRKPTQDRIQAVTH